MKTAKFFVGVCTVLTYLVAAIAVCGWLGVWPMLAIFGGAWLVLCLLIVAAEQGVD